MRSPRSRRSLVTVKRALARVDPKDAAIVAGLLCLAIGCWLFMPALAFVTVGLFLLGAGVKGSWK